jgi:hypothetical protein
MLLPPFLQAVLPGMQTPAPVPPPPPPALQEDAQAISSGEPLTMR